MQTVKYRFRARSAPGPVLLLRPPDSTTSHGLPVRLNRVTGQLRCQWAHLAIERLLARLRACHPHCVAPKTRILPELAAWQGVCSLRLSPQTSGLARMGRRRDAQLDGEFALYASRRRLRALPGGGSGGLRSWMGSLLSTPLAADFGPGPEAAAEGSAAGLGVFLLRLSPPTSGLARRR